MGRLHLGDIIYRYKEVTVLILFIVLTYVYFGRHLQPGGQRPTDTAGSSLSEEGRFEEIVLVEQNLFSLAHDDARLIKYIRYRYLTPPSTDEYNLKDPNFKNEHTKLILQLFKDKRNGVFIESGASNGESSPTLQLEKEFGWTGLLVECNPTLVPYLKSKHRKAWVAGVCLSLSNSPEKFQLSTPVNLPRSGSLGQPLKETDWTFFDLETVPLYSILQAVEIMEIDFWSLDVGGSEIKILKSLPFDKVMIKVIIMEKQFFTAIEMADLDKFMKEQGYSLYLHDFDFKAHDNVYIHESFTSELQRGGFGYFG